MFKQIKKPNINLKIDPYLHKYDCTYYSDGNEYYILCSTNFTSFYFFFNKNGVINREDSPSGFNFINSCLKQRYFILNDSQYSEKEFAKKTNHLICNICLQFCKQNCFLEYL